MNYFYIDKRNEFHLILIEMKTRILYVLIISLLCPATISGQTDPRRELLNRDNRLIMEQETEQSGEGNNGIYLAFTLNYTEIDRKDAGIFGLSVALVRKRRYAIGMGGYAFLTSYRPNLDLGNIYDYGCSLQGGYTSVFFEWIVAPYRKVHVSFPASAGLGMVAYTCDYFYNNSWYTNVEDSDGYVFAETGAQAEFNIGEHLRLDCGIYYRTTSPVDLQTVNQYNKTVILTEKNVLHGFSVGMTLKMGIF